MQSWIKTGSLMYLKGNAVNRNRILSSNTGEKRNKINKKRIPKAFQNIVTQET